MKKTASVILLILAVHVLPVAAQVSVHVWKADTSWYYPQIGGFLPDRITPVISIVNEGSDTAYQVSVLCEAQAYLRFIDGSISPPAIHVPRLAPGDSTRYPLDMRVQADRYQTGIPWPQRLFWQLDWEQGAARVRGSDEGHAVAMILGNCPGGDGRTERKGLELVLPDTLVLDPGPDGFERRELEVYCLVYSREGLPLTVEDVELKNDWYDERIVIPDIRRLTPRDSILGRVIAPGDTLRVRFQVFVPYMEWRHFVGFQASMTWRHRQECGNYIFRIERSQNLRLQHLPARAATGEMWITLMHPGGVDVALRTSAWCGETPIDIDSVMVTLTDNGEAIPAEYFKPSRYHRERRPLRALFALDVTRTVGEAGLAAYRTAIRTWSRIMEAGQDSLAIYTLAGDVQALLPWSTDTTRIDEALARLSLRDGHRVTGAAHALLDLDPRAGSETTGVLLFFTDGWYPGEALGADSLMRRALREGWIYHRFTTGNELNLDRFIHWTGLGDDPGDALEMRRRYIEHSWRYDPFRYSWFYYTMPCRLGVERDLALTLHGICGRDTTMQFHYTVPDDSVGENGMRFLLRDATVTAGGTLEMPVRYENSWAETYYTTEFLLRYDSTRLRFDSLVTRTVRPWHLVSATPGVISVVSEFWSRSSMDDFAFACFTVLPVSDTTSTVVELEAWERYGACSVLPSRDATVTILPITTAVTTETGPEAFRLLSVFPQPATDRITLELQSDATASCDYRLVDPVGREWLRGRIPAGGQGKWYHTISLPSDIPDGFYLLELRQGVTRRTATVPLRRGMK
ncbi:MAG: VWA domain-containing protein [Bacteroidetes bacterium]|nr:VWA domain-containing protein [Bacteroidota bacterium]